MKKHAVALLTALCVAAGCTASADTAKHERVYVVVNHDGEVQTLLDSVHLENGDALDVLSDRTMLKDIENVSGHETFTLDGETLTWQADGSSIIYQGTSDKRPDVLPHVSFTLNGESATAEEIKNGQGVVTMDVSFMVAENVPYLALTLMPIDDATLTDVSVENGKIVSDGSHKLLIGCREHGAEKLCRALIQRVVVGDKRCQTRFQFRCAVIEALGAVAQGFGTVIKRRNAIIQREQRGKTIVQRSLALWQRFAVTQRGQTRLQLIDVVVQIADSFIGRAAKPVDRVAGRQRHHPAQVGVVGRSRQGEMRR